MSTIKTNSVQIGQSVTATNNFTFYQPTTPDGTIRISNGNAGAATDRITIDSSGNISPGVTNTQTLGAVGDVWSNVHATTFTGALVGNVTGTAVALSTASGSAPSYSARAWVNFNGTGTIAIRANGNVSSIGDNGVGDYTINFNTAMVDANYAVSASMAALNGTSIRAIAGNANYSQTVSACRIQTWSNSAVQDSEFVSIAIFR